MALAELTDVEARLGRTVEETQEQLLALTLLGDAEVRLVMRLPSLLAQAADDDALLARVIAVESAAVVRVLRNPEGFRSEATGPFSYSLDTRAASGFLTILDEEWRQLGLSGAFTIDPTPDLPSTLPATVYDLLYGWR